MPVRVTIGGGEPVVLRPTAEWQSMSVAPGTSLRVDANYYVLTRPTS